MSLEPNTWGPHFWFMLHTISLNYPNNPNAVIKKKYYDFIQNLPAFLPDKKSSENLETSKFVQKNNFHQIIVSKFRFSKLFFFN